MCVPSGSSVNAMIRSRLPALAEVILSIGFCGSEVCSAVAVSALPCSPICTPTCTTGAAVSDGVCTDGTDGTDDTDWSDSGGTDKFSSGVAAWVAVCA